MVHGRIVRYNRRLLDISSIFTLGLACNQHSVCTLLVAAPTLSPCKLITAPIVAPILCIVFAALIELFETVTRKRSATSPTDEVFTPWSKKANSSPPITRPLNLRHAGLLENAWQRPLRRRHQLRDHTHHLRVLKRSRSSTAITTDSPCLSLRLITFLACCKNSSRLSSPVRPSFVARRVKRRERTRYAKYKRKRY